MKARLSPLPALLALALAGCASDPPPPPTAAAPPPAAEPAPDVGPAVGTVEIQQWRLGFIGKVGWGDGTLTYQGRRYPFRVGALGVGGVGVARVRATGEVFNMTDPAQFPGIYAQARAGVVLPGAQVSAPVWLRNSSGVVLRLDPVRTGLALQVGIDGVVIEKR